MPLSDVSDSGQDGVYRPILRARRGELTALHHLDPATAHRVLPILEMSTPGRDAVHETADLIHLVRDAKPATGMLAIDVGALADPDDPLRSPPLDLAEALADHDVGMVTVVRAYDSDRRLFEHGLAARIHKQHAMLRLQPHVDAATPAVADAFAERALRGTGLEPEQLDLIIDLAETGCQSHSAHVEEQARRIARWARGRPWRSLTIAAGAMPANLDDLPTDEAVRVGRRDASLYARLAEPGIGYADYGVTSPARRYGLHHRQLPTLRYTADADWWIYRWARRGGRGDDRCYDLCRALVGSAHWPAAGARFSWGDAEIARRSRTAPGAGTSSSWMAWSTSHHIAHVLAASAEVQAEAA
jgi:hypothetical protein